MSASPISRIKPPALRPEDTVGIVAPASNVNRDALEAGCEALRRAGYRPFYFDSIFDQDLYFAGTVERRLHEFNEMLAREDVRAIICARGGYGANYLLPRLDPEAIRRSPKILVGYSDLTTWLTYLWDIAGLVTFHGPMAAKDWSHAGGIDSASWLSAISGSASRWKLDFGPEVTGLVDGKAEGILYGGCLSILVATLGTRYEIKTEGTILFLEDLATKPYQIDRMLMQLKFAGKLDAVRGIIFGEMLDCVQTTNQGYTLQDVVLRIVGNLGVPVAYGVRSGHVSSRNMTLPFGVKAGLEVHEGQAEINILESAVTL